MGLSVGVASVQYTQVCRVDGRLFVTKPRLHPKAAIQAPPPVRAGKKQKQERVNKELTNFSAEKSKSHAWSFVPCGLPAPAVLLTSWWRNVYWKSSLSENEQPCRVASACTESGG